MIPITKHTNLYNTGGTWHYNADPISKKTVSKSRKMFGAQMTFSLNRPVELNNGEKITEIIGTYIGAGSNTIVYQSSNGIIMKLEAINLHHTTSIAAEKKIRMNNPIGDERYTNRDSNQNIGSLE